MFKTLRRRINSNNIDDAIAYCREFAKANNEGYQFAANLFKLIKTDKMIIHVYTDGNFEFKKIRKRKKEKI